MARDEYLAQERVNHEEARGMKEGSWGWIEWWDHATLTDEYLTKERVIHLLNEPTRMRTYGVILWESADLVIIAGQEQLGDNTGPTKYGTSTAILKKEIVERKTNGGG